MQDTVDPGYASDVRVLSEENEFYRRVLYTHPDGPQLTVMTIQPRKNTGAEIHPSTDQIVYVHAGKGRAYVGEQVYPLYKGVIVVVPKGEVHDIINTSEIDTLHMHVVYSRPLHEKEIYVFGQEE
jgi:mannose-6-phosphate isomerase-like protein (cupin superfamily)